MKASGFEIRKFNPEFEIQTFRLLRFDCGFEADFVGVCRIP